MSRLCCARCNRPLKACICQFIIAVDNDVHVVVLLHPKEVNQAKGTLPLLVNSLTNCTVIEGENFSDNKMLIDLLSHYGDNVALLYPSDRALLLKAVGDTPMGNDQPYNKISKVKCIVLLDATWKKAYRMYQLSTNLHQLKHFALPENLVGQYTIRKTKKEYALSTLEACCYALEIIEGNSKNKSGKYQLLINKFVEFNTFQLSFRPIIHSQNTQ